MKSNWGKDFVFFDTGKIVYISVVFTFHLPKVKEFIISKPTKKYLVGGPALKLMPYFFNDIKNVKVEERTIYDFLAFHNPLATFTTRGCIYKCSFCAVPKIEGEFKELEKWKINPIICDNNIFAASQKHFFKVIESLKIFDFCDFNQGLDVTLLKTWHLEGLSQLKNPTIRIAFDNINKEKKVIDGINKFKKAGFKNINCYVLVGFNDDYEDANYRVQLLIKNKVKPFPMRFHPLDCIDSTNLPFSKWKDEEEIKKFVRYYSRLNWTSQIPYEEFDNKLSNTKKKGLKCMRELNSP